MMVALLLALGLLLPLPAFAQEAPEPPPPPPVVAEPQPLADEAPAEAEDVDRPATEGELPLFDEVLPAEPAPPVAEAPAPPRTLQEDIIDRAVRYYEQTQEAPPEVAAYLASNPALGTVLYLVRYIQSVLIWIFLFLLIGMGGRKLLRPLLGAKPVDAQGPRGYARGERPQATPAVDRRGAIADVVAWLVALAIACEAVGLTWFGALWSGLMGLVSSLVGAVIWLGLLIALAALIAWSFSTYGRRLVLSVIGYFYLKYSDSRPPEGHVFTLPDGREATIVATDALHSVMQPTDGGAASPIPNADIMEQYYSWASAKTGESTA